MPRRPHQLPSSLPPSAKIETETTLPILRVAVTHVPSDIAARAHLGDPHCQEVLSDFTDASGLTLLEGLASRRLSPLDHLRDLWFLKRDARPHCTKWDDHLRPRV